MHRRVTAIYNSVTGYSQNMTVRQWLSGKTYVEQYEFGMKILRELGAL